MKRNASLFVIAAFLLLGLLLTVAFYDVVFLGHTFKVTTANSQALPSGAYGQEHNKPPFIPVNGTDAPVLEEPIYRFIANHLREGILPLWNPHQACGFPLIGMIQVGIFYPLNWLLYFLPDAWGWDALILIRILLAGFFATLLGLRLGMSRPASLGIGLIFMLSGPLVLLQYWTTNVDILLPLLLWTTHALIKDPGPRTSALSALVIGLTLLAGHPEHIFLVHVFNLAFLIFLLIKEQACSRRLFFFLGLSFFIGTLIGSIVLLPFLDLHLHEFWHGHPPGTGLRMEEQRDRAITLILPHFFQKAPITYQWVFAGWWGGYLGLLPVLLSLTAVLASKRRNATALFFALMAFLIISKEYGLFYINWIGALPIFNVCRFAIHTPALAAMAVAVTAGFGIDILLNNQFRLQRVLLIATGIFLIIGGHLFFADSPRALPASLYAFFILLVFILVCVLRQRNFLSYSWTALFLLCFIFGELTSYIHRERPRRFDSFRRVPYIEFLKKQAGPFRSYGFFWAFYPNTASGFGLDDLGYFFGLVPERFVDFVNNLILENHFRRDLRPPALRAVPILQNTYALDLLNVKYFIAPPTSRLRTLITSFDSIKLYFKFVYDEEVSIIERPSAFPRVFIVHRVLFLPQQEAVWSMMKKLRHNLRGVALVHGPDEPDLRNRLQSAPPTDQSQARMVRANPNEVIIEARMENPGMLILSEAFAKDWKAWVNGRREKIYPVYNFLRGVFLDRGTHTIRMAYQPFSFFLGAILTLLGLIFLGVLLKIGSPGLFKRNHFNSG